MQGNFQKNLHLLIHACGICDPECEYLDPKEDSQNKCNSPHICKKYNKRVFHFEFHPYLKRLDECMIESYKNFKKEYGI